MNTKIKSAVLVAAVSGLFAAQPALADMIHWNGYTDGSAAVSIISPISSTTNAGGFSMTDVTTSSSAFQAWCADIFSGMATLESYTLSSGSSFYASDPGKATALSHLASNWLSSVTGNATNSAAFQLALWEIVNETSGGSYSLTGGNFTAGSSSAVLTEATSMLGNLAGSLTYTTSVWGNDSNPTQDLAVFVPVTPVTPPVTQVSEPETYAIMLAGLGLMGFVKRRRNPGA